MLILIFMGELTFWVLGGGAEDRRGAVVIDGNGDGIWWQVLAVAFRRHWAVGGSWRWTAYHRCSSRDATLDD